MSPDSHMNSEVIAIFIAFAYFFPFQINTAALSDLAVPKSLKSSKYEFSFFCQNHFLCKLLNNGMDIFNELRVEVRELSIPSTQSGTDQFGKVFSGI